MKTLKNISLLALIFGFNSMAVDMKAAPVEAAGQQVENEKPCPFKEAMKKMKAMYLAKSLAAAGADATTIEKVMKGLEEMKAEKGAKYKELAMYFKAETLKRLTDAGLTQEKAEEILANYKEQVKDPLRKAIKAAMMEFVKEKMPAGQDAVEDVKPAGEPVATPKPVQSDAAPAQ